MPRLLALLLISTLLACPGRGLAAEGHAPLCEGDDCELLLLHSNHPGHPWTERVTTSVLDSLSKTRPEVDVTTYHLDALLADPAQTFPLHRQLVSQLYSQRKADVVIAVDDEALDFMLRYGEEILPGVPVIFTGVRDFKPTRLTGHPNVTGIVAGADFYKTIDLALGWHKDTTRVAVVTDSTHSGHANLSMAQATAELYTGRIEFEFLSDLTTPELASRLHAQEPGTVILNLSFIRDAVGDVLSAEDSVSLIHAATDLPVYTPFESYLGPGVVGGYMADAEGHGAQAVAMALAVLDGRPPSEFELVTGLNRYTFDHGSLGHWDIDESGLPEGSLVLNEPFTFVREYGMKIVFVLVVLAAQTLFILLLVWMYQRGRREQVRRQALERQYADIVEHSLHGIFQVLPDGQLVVSNPAFASMLGYDDPDDIMRNVENLTAQLFNADEAVRLKALVARNPVIHNFETLLKKRDGDLVYVNLQLRAVREEEGGKVSYLEGSCLDITKRKLAEQAERRQRQELEEIKAHLEDIVAQRTQQLRQRTQALESTNVKLREVDSMKSAFLSTVSHDLRTPLASVKGFSQLVAKDLRKHVLPILNGHDKVRKKVDRAIDNLGIITHEGDRLTRLINDLLDLSKIESGQMAWNDQATNIRQVVRDAMQSKAGLSELNQDVELEVNIAPDLPMLTIDADRLRQVLDNLLSNSLKFTESGKVSISAFTVRDRMQLRVADTGPGVPKEALPQIFDKFYQAGQGDTLSKLNIRGTGLGLAIAKQVIEHYGGTIHMESDLGVGTTVVINLPLVTRYESDLDADSPDFIPGTARGRISRPNPTSRPDRRSRTALHDFLAQIPDES